MVKVVILRDIQLHPDGHVFTKKCSRIEYDAKKPILKKLHQLVHQQGERYGTVGDCCEYLTHDQLRKLEESGHIRIHQTYRPSYLATEDTRTFRINTARKPRARKPTLAQILYEAYRDGSEFERSWKEVPPELQKAWERVADAAQEWAYENVQWEE